GTNLTNKEELRPEGTRRVRTDAGKDNPSVAEIAIPEYFLSTPAVYASRWRANSLWNEWLSSSRRLFRHAVIIRIGPGLRVMGWVMVRIERAGRRKLNVQDGMQLDAVSGDSGLAMEEIEHTDASHFNRWCAIDQQELRPGRVLRKGSRKLVPGRLDAIL